MFPTLLWAQQKISIEGRVSDNFTYKSLHQCGVELLSQDSTVISQQLTTGGFQGADGNITYLGRYRFEIPQEGEYILRFSMDEYETTCIDIDATKFNGRETVRQIPMTYIQKIRSMDVDEG